MVLLSVLSGALYNILLYRTDTVKTTYILKAVKENWHCVFCFLT